MCEVAPPYDANGCCAGSYTNMLVKRLTAASSVETIYHLDVEPGLYRVTISSSVQDVLYYWSLASF